MTSSTLLTILFVPLVGFLLYRRFRKAFARQEVVVWKMALRFALLAFVAGCVIVRAPSHLSLGCSLAALAAGIGLAFVGSKHTKIEWTKKKRAFYTPNKWIGLAVTAIFVGRLIARVFMTYSMFASDPAAARAAGAGQPAFMSSNASVLTLATFCLMAGYYCAYYVLVWRRARRPALARDALLTLDATLQDPKEGHHDGAEPDRRERVRRDPLE